MPRSFTAFVAQTDDPTLTVSRIESALGDELPYEQATPRTDVPGRIRIEGGTWFREELHEALTNNCLGPIEWAVTMVINDDRFRVHAWVYDGAERIDTFAEKEGPTGLQVESYLERFHGVVVDRAGPYYAGVDRRRQPYNPDLGLASTGVERTLADTHPSPPFEVTGDDGWLRMIAETHTPDAFSEYVADRLQTAECLILGDRDTFIDREWVADWTTVAMTTSGSRLRLSVPLSVAGVTDEGLSLPLTIGEFHSSVDWVIWLYGNANRGLVDAWLFVPTRETLKLNFDEAHDWVEGESGRHGADVAAYFDRYYGLQIEPTPDKTDVPEVEADVPPDQTPAGRLSATELERAGIDFSPPVE